MSGDHNQYQKGKSYLDDFECPRCGHCCQADQPTQQEPIAWMHTTGTGHVYFRKKPQDKVFNPQPVYTAPPKREWVGLHGSEVPDPYKYDVMFNEGWWWAEDKLKEKNHG